MKKYRSLLPIVGIALLTLAGCGTSVKALSSNNDTTGTPGNLAQSSANTSVSKTVANVTASSTGKTKSFKTSYTDEQLAAMTPAQLAQYREKHGTPLPFASKDVSRVSPGKSQVFYGASSVLTVNKRTLQAADFKVVDLWSGTIQGKAFQLQIDKSQNGGEFVVDVWSGSKGTAMTLSKQPWITNFSGSYVVFATPNPAQGNPMYAINLSTGEILQNRTDVRAMSGVGMGGYPSVISGLPKQYNTFPNGQSY